MDPLEGLDPLLGNHWTKLANAACCSCIDASVLTIQSVTGDIFLQKYRKTEFE